MFRPMAATLIFALTRLAVAVADGDSGPRVVPLAGRDVGEGPRSSFGSRSASTSRCFRWVQPRPWLVTFGVLLMLGATIPVAMNLGGEFIPKLDEGDLVLDLTRPPDALAVGSRGGLHPTRKGFEGGPSRTKFAPSSACPAAQRSAWTRLR